jgi:hypothetical protein
VLALLLAACSSTSVTPPRLVAQTSSPAARRTPVAQTPHPKPRRGLPATRPHARRRLLRDAAQICISGNASGARDVSDAEKAAVYARYGVAWSRTRTRSIT